MSIKEKGSGTRLITVSAALVALCIAWITFVPTIPISPWSFTPFSHIFIFVALFINPLLAAIVTIGTFVAFFIKGMPVDVLLRALSHIVFAIYAMFFIEYAGINKKWKFAIFTGSTAIIHGIVEAFTVILLIKLGYVGNKSAWIIWGTVCGATMLHSIIDTVAGYYIFSKINKPLMLRPKSFLMDFSKKR